MDDFDAVSEIRTPDQRLRVFVSSTLVELADERAAVERAISALRLTPVMFELGARPHPPRELYRAYLAQSDIFLGLYWQRYGWIGPGMDISGLEDEFRLSGSMPRLLYVKAPAPDREPGLTAMLGELQTEGSDSYRTFRTARELGRLVRDDLALLLSERFAARDTTRARPAAPSGPRSLPVTSTSLIGRDDDLKDVVALLRASDVRMVTLTGPGGIGKTRLAIAVGEAVEPDYPNGVVFVPLAAASTAELALLRIAAALGVVTEGSRSPLDVVVERLADRHALLVLDNLEQVTDVAPDLDQLLARCPGVVILATSRTMLRLRAEREFPVSPLAVPAWPDVPPLGEIAALPAVQLFVDRARAIRYDFSLTDENAASIVEICRRLDGLPLAIELAAARTRLLDPPTLLSRLGNVLDDLGPGSVDLPERQRTLRATVEWSVALLDETERQMLETLSVFADGWTIDAAADVASVSEDRALELLDALAGHSLVQVELTGRGPRFTMLTSVREFAAEGLAVRDDHPSVERLHADHYRRVVENAEWPAERQAEWAERLAVDEENVRLAVRWFLDHDILPLPHLFRILWLFWQMRGRMPEGREWIAQVQQRAGELDDRTTAELLFTSAVTAVEVGDDDTALAALAGLRHLDGHIDDPYLQSAAQLAISWIVPLDGDLDGALAAASAALDGFRGLNDPFEAFAALTVGMVEMALGRFEGSLRHLTEVEQLGSRYDNRWLVATARSQLARLAVVSGELAEARRTLLSAVDVGDEADLSTLNVTFSLVAAAGLALAQGDSTRAATALGAADGLRQRSGLRGWPSTRPHEADLVDDVKSTMSVEDFAAATAAGAQLGHRGAVDLIRQAP